MIRPAELSDMTELRTLAHEVHAHYVPHHGQFRPPPQPDLEAALAAGWLHVWAAGRVRGYLVSHAAGDDYLIDALGTDRQHGHEMVAHDLMTHAETHALAADCRAVALHDDPLMQPHADDLRRIGYHVLPGGPAGYLRLGLRQKG